MKGLLLGSLLLASTNAMAAGQSASVLLGIDRGGPALGANFDIEDSATEAYGGYARLFGKDEDEGEPALFALGAHFKGQIKSGIVKYYMAPGFGLVQHTNDESKLLLGPSFNIGLTAELDKTISLGVENTKLYSWVGKYKGFLKDAFFAQATFGF